MMLFLDNYDMDELSARGRDQWNHGRDSEGILIADAIIKEYFQGNTAICSMLGYTKEEIVSLTVYDVHPMKDISNILDE